MSDLPDDIKSALNAALAPLATRIEALESKAVTAAHAETQSLVKAAHDKIDAAKKAIWDEGSDLAARFDRLEQHVTATVEGALHSPFGLALGAGIAFALGIAALALAQHLGFAG